MRNYHSDHNPRLTSLNSQLTRLRYRCPLHCTSYSLPKPPQANHTSTHINPTHLQRKKILQLLNSFRIDNQPKILFEPGAGIIFQRSQPLQAISNDKNKQSQKKQNQNQNNGSDKEKSLFIQGQQQKFRRRCLSEGQSRRVVMNFKDSTGLQRQVMSRQEIRKKERRENYTQTSELKGFQDQRTNMALETEIENDLVFYMNSKLS